MKAAAPSIFLFALTTLIGSCLCLCANFFLVFPFVYQLFTTSSPNALLLALAGSVVSWIVVACASRYWWCALQDLRRELACTKENKVRISGRRFFHLILAVLLGLTTVLEGVGICSIMFFSSEYQLLLLFGGLLTTMVSSLTFLGLSFKGCSDN